MNTFINHRLAPVLATLFLLAGAIAADHDPKIDQLIRQLGAPKFEDREQAMKDLIAVGPAALPALRKAAEARDPEVVRRAMQCVAIIARNVKIAAAIVKLKDKDPKVQSKGHQELAAFGPDAASAVPALIEALDDPHVRRFAVGVLRWIGPAAKPAVPKLVEILKDPKTGEDFRVSVVSVLADIGPEAREAVPLLVDLLQTGSERLRTITGSALGRMGGDHKLLVPALLKALKDPHPNLQGNAALALGRIGAEASVCVPAILEAWKKLKRRQKKDDPRESFVRALGLFAAKARAAVPALSDLLVDQTEEEILRRYAIEALQEIGSAAAVPPLIGVAKNFKEGALRLHAIRALAYIGPEAKEAIPILEQIAKGGVPSPGSDEEGAIEALQAIQRK